MIAILKAHDPSARDAGTSPRKTWGGTAPMLRFA